LLKHFSDQQYSNGKLIHYFHNWLFRRNLQEK
jgi:hypothetical protein